LYELLINCIPPEIILKVRNLQCIFPQLPFSCFILGLKFILFFYILSQKLLSELLKKLDEELKHEVCHWAAYYVRYNCSFLVLSAFVTILLSPSEKID